jgi:hypothetical protein
LCEVEADAGRLEPNDSPRGESIFVTGSPKIYREARGGAPDRSINMAGIRGWKDSNLGEKCQQFIAIINYFH